MHRSLAALATLAVLSLPGLAGADAKVPPEIRAAYTAKGTPVRLTVIGWGDKASARLAIGTGGSQLLYTGKVAGTLAAGHGRVVVALATDAEADWFRIVVIDGDKAGKPVSIANPTGQHDTPFAVAATETPDGFAVFFQEVPAEDPSNAHTYMLALDKQGVASDTPHEIPVPWWLAAAAWNGTGFHLALIYSEGSTGMRLSMVSVSETGQTSEHPDWASRSGFIADVHLVAADGHVRAIYRGGVNGDRMMESDVTRIGNWGTEPAKGKDRGALPARTVIAIDGEGRAKKLRSGK